MGIGTTELLIVLLIVLLIFGASKLPALGAGLGKGIQNFKKAAKGDAEGDDKPAVGAAKSESVETKAAQNDKQA
jgi:sec-independent protein translocase protein TatA